MKGRAIERRLSLYEKGQIEPRPLRINVPSVKTKE